MAEHGLVADGVGDLDVGLTDGSWAPKVDWVATKILVGEQRGAVPSRGVLSAEVSFKKS